MNSPQVIVPNSVSMPRPVIQPEVNESLLIEKHKALMLKSRMAIKKKPVNQGLSKADSIALNLKLLPGSEGDLFQHNALTQILHPIDTLSSNQAGLLQLNDFKEAIQQASKDSIAVTTSVEQINPLMKSTPKVSTGFGGEMIWMVPALVLIVAIVGWIRLASGKFFRELFNAVVYVPVADNLYKITHFRKSAWSVGLTILFVVIFGMLGYELLVCLGVKTGLWGWLMWAIVTAVLAMVYILKNGIYRFLGWVFNTREETRKFLFYVNLMNKALGVMLLPIVVVIPFVKHEFELILLGVGFVLFGGMYLIQLFKGVKIILREPLSVFYMILYLCALEILPIVAMIKVVMMQSV